MTLLIALLAGSSNNLIISQNETHSEYPDWFLEEIFYSNKCIHGVQYDQTIFFENPNTLTFLKRKASQGNIKAISYLGMPGNIEEIEFIASFLNAESNRTVKEVAIKALGYIGTPKCVDFIGREIRDLEQEESSYFIHIIYALTNIASIKAQEYLQVLNDSIVESTMNQYMKDLVQKSLRTVTMFNENDKMKQEIIKEKLYSGNTSDFNWALYKIRYSDQLQLEYLRILRQYTDSLEKNKPAYNYQLEKILTLRKHLGDKKFTAKEKKILKSVEERIEISKRHNAELLKRGKPKDVNDY